MVEIDDKNPVSYFNRGRTYHALKDYQKAIADYSTAIEAEKLGTVYYTKHPIVASLEWGE